MKHTGTILAISLCLAACSGSNSAPQPQPQSTSGGATEVADAAPAAVETPDAAVEAPVAAPVAFAPTDAHRAAWRAATTTLDFNARANFGGGALATGFTPDPGAYALTAGGGRTPVDVASLNIVDALSGDACTRSFVTRRPDFHFTFAAGTTFPMVRFYVVTTNSADATLLINQPDTTWRCNDDHHHEGWGNPLMPTIDIPHPAAGRYDIWVGSFDQSHSNRAQLFVTELDSNHP